MRRNKTEVCFSPLSSLSLEFHFHAKHFTKAVFIHTLYFQLLTEVLKKYIVQHKLLLRARNQAKQLCLYCFWPGWTIFFYHSLCIKVHGAPLRKLCSSIITFAIKTEKETGSARPLLV